MDLAVGAYPEPWVATKEFLSDLRLAVPEIERIVYIPGNHDHHVWTILAEYQELLRRLPDLKRDIYKDTVESLLFETSYGFHTPMHALFPREIQERVAFSYPFHVFFHEPSRTRLVFHHGHYFDPSIAPLGDVGARRYGDIRKVEALNLAYMEGLFYLFSWDPLVQRAELEYYSKLTSLGLFRPVRWLRKLHGFLRGGRRGQQRRELARIDAIMRASSLRDKHLPEKDIWVFGHTHNRGEQLKETSRRILNLGGWVMNHDPEESRQGAWSTAAVFHWTPAGGPRLDSIDLEPAEMEAVREHAVPLMPARGGPMPEGKADGKGSVHT